ncbi:MAG: ABC transporter substrate-binding protein [Firmicutes bacterium]|jgi:branched-chain amino acid transport system substrate-binding protein|nr:ABC transporter substrate-binding protein [Bacillota bacterium]
MKNYKVIIIAILLILSLSIYLYSNYEKTLNIGFASTLSGNWSQIGIDTRNGFLLRLKEFNENNEIPGLKINPIFFDDKNDKEHASSLGKTFVEENIDIVIGFTLSQMKDSVEKIMSENDILFISPTMSTYELTGKKDNFIRVVSDSMLQGDAILAFIKDDNYSNTIIIYDINNSGYSIPLTGYILEKSDKYNISILKSIGIDTTNYNSQDLISSINESNPKSLIFIANAIDVAKLSQILKLNDIQAAFYSSTWGMTSDLIEIGGKTIEGTLMPGFFDYSNKSDKYISFSESFEKEFGHKPITHNIYGYEALDVLITALKYSKSTNKNDIKEAILDISHFQGLQSNFIIDEYGDAKRPYGKFTIKNGKYIRIDNNEK